MSPAMEWSCASFGQMLDKMKSTLLNCAALLILLTQLPACSKKSSSSSSTPTNSCKLTGINVASANGLETCSITYNSDGKVSTVIQSSSSSTLTATYTYSGNIILMTTSGYTNGDVVTDSVVVNSYGLMLSDLTRNMFDTSLTTYTYAGTEVASSIFQEAGQPSSATTYTFTNGDLTGSGPDETFAYNDTPSAQGDYIQLIQLLTFAAPYIKNAHQCISSTANGVTSNYNYTYDSTGKITQLVMTGSENATVNYSYDCN
jgi:hypothetical protein